MLCPKCDSDDVLVGAGGEPNRCPECEHSWTGEDKPIEEAWRDVRFKRPDILFLINLNLRRDEPTLLESRLEERLKLID